MDQKRNPGRTLDVINQLDADIIVLQEADLRLAPRHPAVPTAMIANDTDFHLVDVAANGISLGSHGNAILVRNPSLVGKPGFEPRGAVSVDLKVGGGVRPRSKYDQLLPLHCPNGCFGIE